MRQCLMIVTLVAACQSSDVSRAVGARCASNAECDTQCLTTPEWPGGFCTLLCDDDTGCPDGTRCIEENGGVCAFACGADAACTFLGTDYTCKSRDSHGGGTKVMVCRGG
jgi:hypothetical protein